MTLVGGEFVRSRGDGCLIEVATVLLPAVRTEVSRADAPEFLSPLIPCIGLYYTQIQFGTHKWSLTIPRI